MVCRMRVVAGLHRGSSDGIAMTGMPARPRVCHRLQDKRAKGDDEKPDAESPQPALPRRGGAGGRRSGWRPGVHGVDQISRAPRKRRKPLWPEPSKRKTS